MTTMDCSAKLGQVAKHGKAPANQSSEKRVKCSTKSSSSKNLPEMSKKKKCKGKSPRDTTRSRSPSPVLVEDIIEGFAFASFRNIEDLYEFSSDTTTSRNGFESVQGRLAEWRESAHSKCCDETSIDSTPTATLLSQLPGTPGRNDSPTSSKGSKHSDKSTAKLKNKGQSSKSSMLCNSEHCDKLSDKCKATTDKKNSTKCKTAEGQKIDKSKKSKAGKKFSFVSEESSADVDGSDNSQTLKSECAPKNKVLNHIKDTTVEPLSESDIIESLENRESQMDTSVASDHSDDTVIMGPESLEGSPSRRSSSDTPVIETIEITPKKSLTTSPKSSSSNAPITAFDQVDIKVENSPIHKMETMLNSTTMRNNVSKTTFEELLDLAPSKLGVGENAVVSSDTAMPNLLGIHSRQNKDLHAAPRMNSGRDSKLDSSLLEKEMSPSERIIEWKNKCGMDGRLMPLVCTKQEKNQATDEQSSKIPGADRKQELGQRVGSSTSGKQQHCPIPMFNHLDKRLRTSGERSRVFEESKQSSYGEITSSNKAAEASANKHRLSPKPSVNSFERNAIGPPPPLKPAQQVKEWKPEHSPRQHSLATVARPGYTGHSNRLNSADTIVTTAPPVTTAQQLTHASRSNVLIPSSRSHLSSPQTLRSPHSARIPISSAHIVRDQPKPIPGLSGTSRDLHLKRDIKAASPYDSTLQSRSGSASNIPSSPIAAAYPVPPSARYTPTSSTLLPPHISPSISQSSFHTHPESSSIFPSFPPPPHPAAQLLPPAPPLAPRASPAPLPHIPPRASPAPLSSGSSGGLLAPPSVGNMFAAPPLTAAVPGATAPGVPPYAGDHLLHNPELLSRAQQELNTRLMSERLAPVSPLLRTEMHQHQHQHLHQHNYFPQGQGSSPLLPPSVGLLGTTSAAASLVPGLPGYPNLGPVPPIPGLPSAPGSQLGSGLHGAFQPKGVPSAAASSLHPAQLLLGMHDKPAAPSAAASSNSTSQPGNKKSGKWCAAHVRIAWEIHLQQQKQKSGSGAGVTPHPTAPHEHKALDHMSAGGLPRPELTPNPSSVHPANSQIRNPFESASDLSASLLNPAHLGAVPPFPRPYGSLAGLGTPPFGGLGSLASPYSRDLAALRHLHGMASPHDWNRLQRTPPSFPQPPATLSKEGGREKEALDRDRDFREKDRLKELQRRSPSVRGVDLSGRRSLDTQHSRSSLDLMERARSRSPIRNGPMQDTSHRSTPLMRSSSSSSSDMKLKEERKEDVVVIDDRDRYSHERQNGFKNDLHSKLESQAAMSRIADYMSPPHLPTGPGLAASLMDRARFYPPYAALDRPMPPGFWSSAADIDRNRELHRDFERHRDSMLSRLSAIERERLIDYERKTLGGLGGVRHMDLYGLGASQGGSMVMHHRTTSPQLQSAHSGTKTSSPIGTLGAPPPLIPNSSHHINHSTSSSHSSQLSQSPASTKTKSASPLVNSQDEKTVTQASNGLCPENSSR